MEKTACPTRSAETRVIQKHSQNKKMCSNGFGHLTPHKGYILDPHRQGDFHTERATYIFLASIAIQGRDNSCNESSKQTMGL